MKLTNKKLDFEMWSLDTVACGDFTLMHKNDWEKIEGYPEFIAQGSIIKDQQQPNQVLIRCDSMATINRLKTVYTKLCTNQPGFCIMDPLSAENENQPLHLSRTTDKVNDQHLDFQFKQYLGSYDERETITFKGVSYKEGSDILEESQQLALAVMLAREARRVRIVDNKSVIDQLKKSHSHLFELLENE